MCDVQDALFFYIVSEEFYPDTTILLASPWHAKLVIGDLPQHVGEARALLRNMSAGGITTWIISESLCLARDGTKHSRRKDGLVSG